MLACRSGTCLEVTDEQARRRDYRMHNRSDPTAKKPPCRAANLTRLAAEKLLFYQLTMSTVELLLVSHLLGEAATLALTLALVAVGIVLVNKR